MRCFKIKKKYLCNSGVCFLNHSLKWKEILFVFIFFQFSILKRCSNFQSNDFNYRKSIFFKPLVLNNI